MQTTTWHIPSALRRWSRWRDHAMVRAYCEINARIDPWLAVTGMPHVEGSTATFATGDDLYRTVNDAWARALERNPGGDRIVELGCGVGRLTKRLLTEQAHVTAIDASPRMVELAAYFLGQSDQLTLRCATTVHERHHFDHALAINCLHNMPSRVQARVLSDLAQSVRPGGMIVADIVTATTPAASRCVHRRSWRGPDYLRSLLPVQCNRLWRRWRVPQDELQVDHRFYVVDPSEIPVPLIHQDVISPPDHPWTLSLCIWQHPEDNEG